eukprot:scaffold4838_cov58-Attheya_sp.AAC.3
MGVFPLPSTSTDVLLEKQPQRSPGGHRSNGPSTPAGGGTQLTPESAPTPIKAIERRSVVRVIEYFIMLESELKSSKRRDKKSSVS